MKKNVLIIMFSDSQQQPTWKIVLTVKVKTENSFQQSKKQRTKEKTMKILRKK